MPQGLVKAAVLITVLGVVAGHSHSHSHGHGHGHGHSHGGNDGRCKTALLIPEWVQELHEKDPVAVAVSASLFTSLVPIVILLFCPSAPSRGVLHALLAFAAGSLLGDAMLHLLPHAMADSAPPVDPSTNPVMGFLAAANVSMPHLLFLVGVGVFFFIEKVLRLTQGSQGGHSHSHGEKKPAAGGKKSILGTAAILNLIADTTHNFTDGITIAAAFANSFPVGVSTTLAVFIHEIPHEVGDYAVLLGSGFGKSGAMAAQVVTGAGNLAGALLMSYATKWVDGAESFVLPISAGGFVYIATVSILPELLSSQVSFPSIVMEMVLMSLGVFCMIAIGLIE